jgi:hypothetical protein
MALRHRGGTFHSQLLREEHTIVTENKQEKEVLEITNQRMGKSCDTWNYGIAVNK